MKKQQTYGNDSISALKGADRVRKRPAVIFGSDGLDGCEHAVFEILSNAIDEAREGHGNLIIVTRYLDHSIEVTDFGRGCPVDWNEKEGRYNWELVFCELYAGGKYKNNTGGDYEYSLGLNGLGACATQYASRYFDAAIRRDGYLYTLHFERGELVGEMKKTPADQKKTGSSFHWLPDLDVFTDIDIPKEYYEDTLKRQAVVNAGITFRFRCESAPGRFDETEYFYENGILDYIREITQDQSLTAPQFWEAERKGRDRSDMDEYKVKISAAFCFSNQVSRQEYYHNSSWLEYGGAPEKAVKNAFVYAIDAYLKSTNKYTKTESKITFQDVADCLVLVTNCFSTKTSYENQTKKAITNKFVQDAMTEFFRDRLHVYFIENKQEADRIAEQVLINKRSRETAEKQRLNIKKKLTGNLDIANRVQKFVDCRTKDVSRREIYIVEGDSALGSVKLSRDAEFQGIMPVRGKILNCLKADYDRIFKSDIITDLIRVLGCGVEVQTKKAKDLSSFDLANLRWNKVVKSLRAVEAHSVMKKGPLPCSGPFFEVFMPAGCSDGPARGALRTRQADAPLWKERRLPAFPRRGQARTLHARGQCPPPTRTSWQSGGPRRLSRSAYRRCRRRCATYLRGRPLPDPCRPWSRSSYGAAEWSVRPARRAD